MRGFVLAAFGLTVALAASTLAAQEPTREEIVQALLERSRDLEKAHFEIPLGVWKKYLHETIKGPQALAPSPVAFIAEQGDYRLELPAGPDLKLSATVRLRVFDPAAAVNLPVLTNVLSWRNVQINGRPETLAVKGDWLWFTPAEAGEFVITAETALPRSEWNNRRWKLPVPRTVRTLLALDSDGAWELLVEGDTRTVRGDDRGTHGSLGFTPRDEVVFRFRPPEVVRERPPRYELTGAVAWNLDAGRQQVAARLDVGIVDGRTNRLDLTLPADAVDVKISGPDVREAQVKGGRAEVFLRGKVEGRTQLEVSFEAPRAQDDTLRFAGIELADGHWAGGTVVVTNTAGGSEVLPASSNGLTERGISEIPSAVSAMLAGPPALAYAISGRNWSLEVETIDLGEFALTESIADLAHYEVSLQRDGTMMVKATWEIRNRHRQFLRIAIPSDAHVLLAKVNDKTRPLSPADSVSPSPLPSGEGRPLSPAGSVSSSPLPSGEGRVREPGEKAEGEAAKLKAETPASRDWLLPLVRSTASVEGLVSFPAEITYLCRTGAPTDGDSLALPLPRIDIPIAYAWCETYLPEGMRVRRFAGPLRRVDRYASETARASMEYGSGQLAEGYEEASRPRAVSEEPYLPGETVEWGGKDIPALEKGVFAPEGRGSQALVTSSLGANYWRAGKELYERNEFDAARQSLEKAIELAPDSPEAANARRLLANIKLAQGELELKTKAQKAAGAEVRSEQRKELVRVEEQQDLYLERGVEAARAGKLDEAREQLEAAESLSSKFVDMGGGRSQQDAKMAEGRQLLERIRTQQQEQAKELLDDISRLETAGDYERALQNARRAMQLGDDDLDQLANEKIASLIVKSQEVKPGTYTAGLVARDTRTAGKYAGREAPPAPTGGAFDQAIAGEKVRLQLAETEIVAKLARGNGYLRESRFEDALKEFDAAQTKVKYGNYSPDFKKAWLDRIQARIDKAQASEDEYARRQDESKKRVAVEVMTTELGEMKTQRAERKDQLMDRARTFIGRRQYDDALAALDRARTLDAEDEDIPKLIEHAEEKRLEDRHARAMAGRRADAAETMINVDGQLVPWADVQRHPSDWKARSDRRLRATEETGGEQVQDSELLGRLRWQRQALLEAQRTHAGDYTRYYYDGDRTSRGLRARIEEVDRAIAQEEQRLRGESPLLITDGTAPTPWHADPQAVTTPGRAQRFVRDVSVQVSDKAVGYDPDIGTPQSDPAFVRPAAPTIADREGMRKLSDTVVSFTFTDQPVPEAIDFLRTLGGVDIAIQEGALADPDQTVTLKLQNVTLQTALMLLCEQLDLSYSVAGGRVIVMREVPQVSAGIRAFWRRDGATYFKFIDGEEPTAQPGGGGGGGATTQTYLVQDLLGGMPNFTAPTFELQDLKGNEPLAVTEPAVEGRAGQTVVTHTPEVQAKVSALLENIPRQRAAGQAGQSGQAADDEILTPEENAKNLRELILDVIEPGTWTNGRGIYFRQGQIVVVHEPEVQQKVQDLLGSLRKSSGPQVEQGLRIAEQKAKGVIQYSTEVLRDDLDRTYGVNEVIERGRMWSTDTILRGKAWPSEDVDLNGDGIADAQKLDPRLREFIEKNYRWTGQDGGWEYDAGRTALATLAIPDDLKDQLPDLVGRLRYNLGQTVAVNSFNTDVPTRDAAALGVRFNKGNNDLNYAIIDEAQLRTLMEMDQAIRSAPGNNDAVAVNPSNQRAIVGTDAWIANGMVGNVAFAGDTGNTIDIAANPIQLSHGRYILIDNGGAFLTVVRTGEMRHWTERGDEVFVVEVPQRIDVPRVGEVSRFEKSLLEPTDDLVIRVQFDWRGGPQ